MNGVLSQVRPGSHGHTKPGHSEPQGLRVEEGWSPQSDIGVLHPEEREMAGRQTQQVFLRTPAEATAWSVKTDLAIGVCDPGEAKWSGKNSGSPLGKASCPGQRHTWGTRAPDSGGAVPCRGLALARSALGMGWAASHFFPALP